MDSAKLLRRTICRLAKEVDKHHDRISVNAMLDLSAQIKHSDLGTHFTSHRFSPFVLLFETMISFVAIYNLKLTFPLTILKHCFNIHLWYHCFFYISWQRRLAFRVLSPFMFRLCSQRFVCILFDCSWCVYQIIDVCRHPQKVLFTLLWLATLPY